MYIVQKDVTDIKIIITTLICKNYIQWSIQRSWKPCGLGVPRSRTKAGSGPVRFLDSALVSVISSGPTKQPQKIGDDSVNLAFPYIIDKNMVNIGIFPNFICYYSYSSKIISGFLNKRTYR